MFLLRPLKPITRIEANKITETIAQSATVFAPLEDAVSTTANPSCFQEPRAAGEQFQAKVDANQHSVVTTIGHDLVTIA